MNVRLTGLCEEELIAHGAAVDPPIVGRPFSILLVHHEKVVVTANVAWVEFDHFVTEQGTIYSWCRLVGEA